MSKKVLTERPIKIVCLNCHKEIICFLNEEGVMKSRCPTCGTVTISKAMGRRHLRLDVYAPQGQELL